jgi:hypothetical protein
MDAANIESWLDNMRFADGEVLGAFLTLHTKTAPDQYRYDGQYFYVE